MRHFSKFLLLGNLLVIAINASPLESNGEAKDGLAVAAETKANDPVPLYRYYNGGSGDHFYTTNFAELGGGKDGYVSEGIAGKIYPAHATGTVAFLRYWNPTVSDHFYTTNFGELGSGGLGYNYEGIQGYVFAQPHSGTVPFYRYYNAATGDHFYTTNRSELGPNGSKGYVSEGIAAYIFRA